MQLLLDIALFIYLKNLSHIKILTENQQNKGQVHLTPQK